MSCCYLGVDLGGSHATAVVIDIDGTVLEKNVIDIHDRSVTTVLPLLTSLCSTTLGKFSLQRICGAGIAVPGNVDPTKGCTRYLPNFGWLDTVPISAHLKDSLNLPVTVRMRNDGRCAALAEYKYGVGKNSAIFAMLTLGTGIGGALITNGKLFDGVSFDAGDFGHHVITSGENAFPCVCGKSGCFECHASAAGLVRHYNRLATINGTTVQVVKNAAEVVELVRARDGLAKQAFDRFQDDLSTGLANLITFYNPDTIALGGGLSQAPEVFHGLLEAVDRKTLPASRGKVTILAASLSVDAGAIGAALLGWFYPDEDVQA